MTETVADASTEPRRPGLRADLRAAVPDAVAALVVTLAIFVWLYVRVRQGVSPTVAIMPMLEDANRFWAYWLCQAFGWSALLWAWLTTMFGLVRSSSRPGWFRVSPARIERWHRTTSLTTVGLMFAHAFLFFVELVRENGYGLSWLPRVGRAFAEVFVPGVYPSGTGVIAILLGLLAFYLAIPLGFAYYLRNRTGARAWRALHRFVLVVYVLSVWHTLLYGTNVWFDGWPRTTLWLLQVPVAVLLLARLLAPARPVERFRRVVGALVLARRAVAVVAALATAVVLVVVAVSGVDGGRTPGEESAPLNVEQWMLLVGTAVLLLAVAVALLVVRRAERDSGNTPRTRR